MRDMIVLSNAGGLLVTEALQSIAGASGAGIDALKIVLVFVIVVTSTVGTIAKDRDGDGVPDIYKDVRRLFNFTANKDTAQTRQEKEKD